MPTRSPRRPHQFKSKAQVFLRNPKVVRQIVTHGLDAADAVVEIGPGGGVLTRELVKSRLPVVVIEIDKYWCNYLESKLLSDNLEIIQADFLDYDFFRLIRSRFNHHQKVNIISNLPYYLTGLILFKLVQAFCQLQQLNKMVLMMQKEVGQRIIATQGAFNYSYLSLYMQHFFAISPIVTVSRQDFYPQPKVASMVLEFQFSPQPINLGPEELHRFFRFVKKVFIYRRKTIFNCLHKIGLNRDIVAIIIKKSGVTPTLRPQNLGINDFKKLWIALPSHVRD